MVNAQLLLQALAGETPVGGGGGFAVTAVAVFASGLITQLSDFGQRGVTGFNRHTAAAGDRRVGRKHRFVMDRDWKPLYTEG